MNHGGNIYELSHELKVAERKIIDFSASINPMGVSKRVKTEIRKHLRNLCNYPDPDCSRLKWFISRDIGVPEKNLICGNGSNELIYTIVRSLNPDNVLIPSPVFSEYERAVRVNSIHKKTECLIRFHDLSEENSFKPDIQKFANDFQGMEMAFLCNPNNPTAAFIDREAVMTLAQKAKEAGCYLVIDEAFIDFLTEGSVVDIVIDNPYLIVLRSLTKYYALSGLRLGYAAAHTSLINRIEAFAEPWNVNSLAQRAGVEAIRDKFYRKETVEFFKKEKLFFEKSLKENKLFYYPSGINYYLIKSDKSLHIYNYLRRRGILVRTCHNFRGLDDSFLRLAVKTRKENTALFRHISNMES